MNILFLILSSYLGAIQFEFKDIFIKKTGRNFNRAAEQKSGRAEEKHVACPCSVFRGPYSLGGGAHQIWKKII